MLTPFYRFILSSRIFEAIVMAELLKLGKHCDLEGCNLLDFLPVTCNYCLKIFCKEHFSYVEHNCAEWKTISQKTSNPAPTLQKFNCHFLECRRLEETEIVCPKCQQNFCMVHRLEKDHQCGYKKPEYMPKTAELVSQIVKQNQEKQTNILDVTAPKSKNIKAQKTAAKVQLMKLKSTAVGQKNVSLNDRIYFKIYYPLSKAATLKGSEKCKGVYVSKSWSFGKVLDIISDLCGVENKNNVGCENNKKLRLFKHSSGEIVTVENYSVLLDELIKSEKILNGESLIFEYVKKDLLDDNDAQLDVTKYKI